MLDFISLLVSCLSCLIAHKTLKASEEIAKNTERKGEIEDKFKAIDELINVFDSLPIKLVPCKKLPDGSIPFMPVVKFGKWPEFSNSTIRLRLIFVRWPIFFKENPDFTKLYKSFIRDVDNECRNIYRHQILKDANFEEIAILAYDLEAEFYRICRNVGEPEISTIDC